MTASSMKSLKRSPHATNFEKLPEDVVRHILSFLSQAKHVAVAATVCKQFSIFLRQNTCLHFPRTLQEKFGPASGYIIMAMVAKMSSLQELVVYCSHDHAALFSWILNVKHSLQTLELRMDPTDVSAESNAFSRLEHISLANKLSTLKLWGANLREVSQSIGNIRPFNQLKVLEITGTTFSDTALARLQNLCPILEKLKLIAVEGLWQPTISGDHLESLCIHSSGRENCSIRIKAALLKYLDIHGAKSLVITQHSLQEIAIGNLTGAVEDVKVEGNLLHLRKLILQGGLWRWGAIEDTLAAASHVEDLVMGVEFCAEEGQVLAFPSLDLADFFASHSKLKRFDCRGAMFASLSSRGSLRKVGPETQFEHLEVISIKIRSHLNIKNKIGTLSSILECSPELRTMDIRLSQIPDSGKLMNELYKAVALLQQHHPCIRIS